MVYPYWVEYYTVFKVITEIVVNVNVANEKAIKCMHTPVSKIKCSLMWADTKENNAETEVVLLRWHDHGRVVFFPRKISLYNKKPSQRGFQGKWVSGSNDCWGIMKIETVFRTHLELPGCIVCAMLGC